MLRGVAWGRVVTSLSPLATHMTIESTIRALPGRQMVLVLPSRRENCAYSPQTGTGGCLPPQDAHHFRLYVNTPMNTKSASIPASCQNEILDAQALLTETGCHLTFTRCPSHSGIDYNAFNRHSGQRGDNCGAGSRKSSS